MTRPDAVVDAFRNNDLHLAGSLMDDSHESLKTLYEVSCEELDVAVEIAREHEACFGARLTGAGFGGCAIALCAEDQRDNVAAYIEKRYRERFGTGSAYTSRASVGVRIVS